MPTPPDPYRPHFHYTPKQNWINDPNGLVYFEGEYHLFYQHNPFANIWGNMSWGHAISRDLVRWEELPVALPYTDGVMVFSGSAVVDWHNTSGFGMDERPPLVAIFTGYRLLDDTSIQDQRLAYSNDKGRSWTIYTGNPVLDRGLKDFRDPKVFWHVPSQKWVMVLVVSDQHKVQFYGSPDLKNWQHLSDFGPMGSRGGVWEVPELIELRVENQPGQTRWVLKVDVGEGGPWGGSAAQYFVGQFDGTGFIPDEQETPRWVEYGQDFYAAICWSDLPKNQNRTVWLGWMSNWAYAAKTPTDSWRGAMTIPRSLSLREHNGQVHLVQQPVPELQSLRGQRFSLSALTLDSETKALSVQRGALEIVAVFKAESSQEFGIKLRVGDGEETRVGYDSLHQALYLDRRQSGQSQFGERFAGLHSQFMPLEDGRVELHIFVDHSSVEVFGNHGQAVISDLIFPKAESTGVEVYAQKGSVRLEVLEVWELEGS